MNERQRKKFEERFGQWPGLSDVIRESRWMAEQEAYSAACRDEADAAQGLVRDAKRALEAWDSTVLPSGHDGMMQERMECLRAAIQAFKGDAK